jgi:hypothetical protein
LVGFAEKSNREETQFVLEEEKIQFLANATESNTLFQLFIFLLAYVEFTFGNCDYLVSMRNVVISDGSELKI